MKRRFIPVLVACVFVAAVGQAAVNTYSSSPALFVPTVGSASTTLNVPDAGIINDIDLTVTLQHPLLADVQIYLQDPSGTVNVLAFDRDGGVGDGLYNVTFDDSAGGSPPGFLTNGQCLTNQTYTPEVSFLMFAGLQMQGTWTLTVVDNAGPDSPDCDCDGLVEGPPCPRTLDSWSIRINYSTNQAPVALCQDVTVAADANSCTASASVDAGSYDPDGDALTITQDPPGPYGIGVHNVTLTVTDPLDASSSCNATVTVVDETGPVISCNAPATITPPDAPVSFTATASDACGSATVEVTAYDCYTFTKKGKRIDKRGSCAVEILGDTVTITDSGGVGDIIEWTVSATDANGNTSQTTCQVTVVNPGH
jgi:subtilisin-like proprotein convertase family protein